MDRKEFITKLTGVLVLGGLTIAVSGMGHSDKKFTVISKRCDGCGHCFKACREKALTVASDGKAIIDMQKCTGCGDCCRFCRRMAIVEAETTTRTSTPQQG